DHFLAGGIDHRFIHRLPETGADRLGRFPSWLDCSGEVGRRYVPVLPIPDGWPVDLRQPRIDVDIQPEPQRQHVGRLARLPFVARPDSGRDIAWERMREQHAVLTPGIT